MPIFNGVPPGKNKKSSGTFSVTKDKYYASLCLKCQEKFKNFLKKGGKLPKACDVCQEKLKTKMLNSRL